MIFYGDPAFAPFAKNASRLHFAEINVVDDRCRVRMGYRPLIDGAAAQDFFVPQSRLTDYYSVKTADIMKELSLEVYRAVTLPPRVSRIPKLAVTSARCGDAEVPTGEPQVVVETSANGDRALHVRVPIKARVVGSLWTMRICTQGVEMVLDEERMK
jgi:hypothetical protein